MIVTRAFLCMMVKCVLLYDSYMCVFMYDSNMCVLIYDSNMCVLIYNGNIRHTFSTDHELGLDIKWFPGNMPRI